MTPERFAYLLKDTEDQSNAYECVVRECLGEIKRLQAEVERLKADIARRDSDLARLDMGKVLAPTIELLEAVERFFSGRVFLKGPIVGCTAINSELARPRAVVEGKP